MTALKIAVIQSGETRPRQCAYGRVHSSITNLRKKVRPALQIHGQELVEVDVSCAQPLILGFVVAKLLAGNWSVADVKRLGVKGELSEPFKNLPMSRWTTELPADLLDYIDLCQRGQFYETLANTWGLPDGPENKNKIKGLVFKLILFGKVRLFHTHWKAFRARWPSVASVLEELKRDAHGTVARASQRIEARLMVDGVIERFRRSWPLVPIQLIHDAVLVTTEAVEIAREAILAEFGSIGLIPGIKPEKQETVTEETTSTNYQVKAV